MGVPPPLVASTDAGGFYCEHAHFAHVHAARGTIARVGFLHIPDDEPTWGRPGPRRPEETLAIVERLVETLLPRGGRLLLTGFAPWGQVVDNPSGAFVASPRALATLAGSDAPIPGRGVLVAKGIRREIVAAVLPVDDSALATIAELHAALRPDAALGMGVVANGDTAERTYRIELCATNRNLVLRDGRWAHADGSLATVIRPTRALRAALTRP